MTVIQVIVDQTNANVPIQNTLFFDVVGGDEGDFTPLGAALDTVFSALEPNRGFQWVLDQYQMRIPDGTGIPFTVVPSTLTIIGDLGSEDLPRGTSLVAFSRSQSGPPNKAWQFHSGFEESQNTSLGLPITAAVQSVVDWATDLLDLDNVGAKTMQWVTARLVGSPQSVFASNTLISTTAGAVWHLIKSRIF